MKAKDFNTFSFQFSIFTPTLLFSANKILANLASKFSNIFDGTPVALPLPQEAPKEIPRLILSSSEGKLKLEIAASRVNLFRFRKEDDTVILENDFLKTCIDVFNEYINFTSAKVGRLAIVAVRFLEDTNPGLTLAKHFCQERWLIEPFNRPENFELHSHKKYELDTFRVNSWVRCKSGFLKQRNVPIILVEQDINTLSEEIETKEFNIEQIKDFSNLAKEEQKSILNKYFPDNG